MKRYNLILTLLMGACCLPQKRYQAGESEHASSKDIYIEDANGDDGFEDIDQTETGDLWESAVEESNWFKLYKASENRYWSLSHTDLKLHLDFEKQEIIGTAILDLSPVFYAQDSLILDAKKLKIESVKNATNGTKLAFRYATDSMSIVIYLKSAVYKNQSLKVSISYSTSQKQNRSRNIGAIAGDDGYYFINAKLQRNIPRQFWTQGETESNSRWFPTLDAPNQKHTQRMEVTVPDTMKVLSNGSMIGETSNEGLKTVIWEQNKAHAVYLTMLAVGNWAVVKDRWNGIPVNYWVEKAYEQNAKDIFGNTPEMIQFFSDYTGISYPWDKYSQVVVRDFVSGAMENTSATVHMEGLHQSKGDLLDNNLEDYVSHELFHQWFGDYVTAESWANITLNESFATYGEYLWKAHKYGTIAADEMLNGFRSSYANWGAYTGNTLLRHNYTTTNEVFDVTSYQKGALILHALRHEIGEEAFRASIGLYLKRYAYENAEVDQLRLCFEEVTGQDLAWFFDQWYKRFTYPNYEVSVKKDSLYHMLLHQPAGAFSFAYGKMDVRYSIQGKVKNATFRVDGPLVRFDFGLLEPDWLIVDPNNNAIGTITYPSSIDGILDFKKVYLAYVNAITPSAKSNLWAEYEKLTKTVLSDEGNSETKDSLRILMMKDAMTSKSKDLAQNVLFAYFNSTNDPKVGASIGLNFIDSVARDQTNPSRIRSHCFSIMADLSKDSSYVYSFINDPSIRVSTAAISRIWDRDKLKEHMAEGLNNPEVDVAKCWFTQSVYVLENGNETFNYYLRLKQHPFFGEIDLPNLMQDVFMYSNNLGAFRKEIATQKNKSVIASAIIGITERLKQMQRNPRSKLGINTEISRLKEYKADLEMQLSKE